MSYLKTRNVFFTIIVAELIENMERRQFRMLSSATKPNANARFRLLRVAVDVYEPTRPNVEPCNLLGLQC